MKIGVPSELKTDEYRVAVTPLGVRELITAGHEVFIQSGAGVGSAISDKAYEGQGAKILPDMAAVFQTAELILGVKEPQPEQVALLEPHHILFTYLHLAPAPQLTKSLQESGATCIAYETVTDDQGRLPLLTPMSEIAGKLATQAGASILEKPHGGRGVLLGGVAGVARATVLVIGGGSVGTNAARVAAGMGANVYLVDRSLNRLRELESTLNGHATLLYSSPLVLEELLPKSDLVIGAVLIHGAKTPKLVTREHLKLMKKHSVLVDVAIDQGGCFKTSHPTTHSDPIFEVDEIVHYCVSNMPGAVPITSTYALTNATLPYVLKLAEEGIQALADPGLKAGLNVAEGKITHPAVAEALGSAYTPAEKIDDLTS